MPGGGPRYTKGLASLGSLQRLAALSTDLRPEDLANLVSALEGQTLEPHRFELIVVDDGGDPPVSIDEGALPFRTIVLRQPNGGPAAARNAAAQASA